MQEEFKRIIDLELNRRSSLTASDKKSLEEWARQTREYYAASNDANERNNILQSAYKKASDIIENENLKQDVSEIISDENEFGKNPVFKLGAGFSQDITKIMTGEKKYEIVNDEIVYEMSNPYGPGTSYMHLHEIKDYIDSKKIDKDSQNAINMLINGVNQGGDFNRDSFFNNVKNNIIVKGNLDSLINDDIFGGRNFRDDFIESTMMSSYKDFDEELKDEKISLEDAVAIFEELLKNREQTIDYVAEYFTKFAEQNRTKPNLQNQEEAGYDPYEFA
ncbi:MAG: hypothetical protein CMC14_08710 [Flavobacteriaceae bacterium]|nr:hypothetical protein [Flavobacteriaceae bacterium]